MIFVQNVLDLYKNSTLSEEVKTNISSKYHSPIPFLKKLRTYLFGTIRPSIYTQFTFYIQLFCLLIFSIWSAISYFVITFRALFLEQKGVNVAEIIEVRGQELGFFPGEFLQRLETFHGISIICWGFVFISLIMLWRKKNAYGYFFFGGTLFYIGMMVFYVGFDYFLNDTTRFDKILFLVMLANSIVYIVFNKNNVKYV